MRMPVIRYASDAEATFCLQWEADGLPKFEREYRFDDVRRFRFDVAVPSLKLAVEIDGGIFGKGGHSTRPWGSCATWTSKTSR